MADPGLSYPIFLRLVGRRCVVIGGGAVAARKVEDLVRRGASVAVIAPDVSGEVLALGDLPGVEIHPRPYQRGDLAGAFLAFAATDDRETNAAVAAEARARNVLVCVADDLGESDFLVPATVERGALCLAVSTGGASPALARHICAALARDYGEEYEPFLAILDMLRDRVRQRVPEQSQRAALFRRVVESDVLDLCRQGKLEQARRRAEELVQDFAEGTR